MLSLTVRRIWQMTLVAILVLLASTLTAAFLLSQQSSLTRGLRSNLDTRRVVVELEECLTDLIALEDAEVESVKVLHDRAEWLIHEVGRLAKEPAEIASAEHLARAFAKYLQHWQHLPPVTAPDHQTARQAATRELNDLVLKPFKEFEAHHIHRLDQLTESQERLLSRLSWTIAGIGTLGAVAAIGIGFGLTRRLHQSIRRLRVQLRNAADKSTSDTAELLVIGEGELDDLHTEADRLTQRIEAMVSMLQRREREVLRAEQLAAVGQLAAGVGHELRNPLTAVKLIVQTGVESGGLTGDDLRIVACEVSRIERTLQAFLDYARPPQLERRPTSLTALIHEVIDLLRGRAKQQQVDWKLEFADSAITLLVDREQLRQVFVNLLMNALDAMPGGGLLTITANSVTNGLVAVEVADTGRGIPPTQLPRLFQPFSSTKDTGLGLGLVVCKRIVEAHSGRLEAKNIPGSGACFTLTLPIEPNHA